MSQVLTVPTHFSDLGELSEGFLDRVEQDTLILYGPVAYEDGSEVEFSILLADGTPALEGMGRVRAAVDGGEDRVPETRYDVVVEALEFAGMYEVVFERLVIERQAVSEPPPDPDEEVSTGEMSVVPENDEPDAEDASEPEIEAVELSDDEVFSLAPSDDDEPEMTLEAASEEASDEETSDEETSDEETSDEETSDEETSDELTSDEDEASDEEPSAEAASDEEEYGETSYEAEEYSEADGAFADAYDAAYAGTDTDTDTDTDADTDTGTDTDAGTDADRELVAEGPGVNADGEIDPDYAFEHGIAAEPQVGMPVPIPSMAAPPEAPPAPPTLRLAEPPKGLTRPSMAQPEEALFTDGEVSDVHTTGLFAYEEGLPIPSRPPMPDANRPQQVGSVEAANDYDVEESEPPLADDDEYEEVRLSDFAEEG